MTEIRIVVPDEDVWLLKTAAEFLGLTVDQYVQKLVDFFLEQAKKTFQETAKSQREKAPYQI